METYVSVIGTEAADETERERARAVGRLLAEEGYRLVCGGRGGIMAAASAGHREAGGRPIGILPEQHRRNANEHLDTAIVTGLGDMRNAMVVHNGAAVVAIGGRYGTLSEIALALNAGKTVIGLDTHDVDGVTAVDSPKSAVKAIQRAVEGIDP